MQTLTVKYRDKYTVRLTIGNPPVDLNGGTTKVFVKPSAGTGAVLSFDATLSGNDVLWALDGTIPVGKYKLEVQVTVGPYIVTAPSDQMMEFVVIPDNA